MCVRCDIRQNYGEDMVFLEPEVFDEAIIGVTWDGKRVVYDAIACVDLFMEQAQDDNRELAHHHFNTLAERCEYNHMRGAPAFVWIEWKHIEALASDEELITPELEPEEGE